MSTECLKVGLRHLSPSGRLVLQVGEPEQADEVSRWLPPER